MNGNIPDTAKKRVVVIGGGFAGLKLIDKLKDKGFQLVLLDKNNYHQFPPLLYQVATAGLEANSISFPFRKMLQGHTDFYFRLAEVTGVDHIHNLVETSIGLIRYDYLVLSAGSQTNFYGNQEIQHKAIPMKSIVEALELRNTLLSNIEQATLTTDEKERKALLNIVVAGGGATGVEIAGAMAEMKKYIMPKDYPELKPSGLNVYLVEGIDRLLGPMSQQSSAKAKEFLEKMGVTIILNKKVTGYDGESVSLDDGSKIRSKTFIWVSGVMAVTFDKMGKETMGHAGRLIVDRFNRVKGMENVFAIGDISIMSTDKNYPKGHPQVAQTAIQQGKLLAENLLKLEKGEAMTAFRYKNLGTLATIGRNKAVADIGKIKMSGFFAWVVWLFVHLRSILGVKNKMMVLTEWIWNYFRYDQSERYIIAVPPPKKKEITEALVPVPERGADDLPVAREKEPVLISFKADN